jgi:hypothetical protein
MPEERVPCEDVYHAPVRSQGQFVARRSRPWRKILGNPLLVLVSDDAASPLVPAACVIFRQPLGTSILSAL